MTRAFANAPSARAASPTGEAAQPYAADTDAALVARTLDGERDCFEELVRRHESAVYARLLRMTGRIEDAEDISQEVFVRAWRGLRTYKPEHPFSAWINRIAWNAGLDAMKIRRPHARVDEIPEPAAPAAASPLHTATLAELRDRLRSAAGRLAPDVGEIFRLRYEEDCPLREIARRQGRSENSIAVILHRARLELRRILSDQGETP